MNVLAVHDAHLRDEHGRAVFVGHCAGFDSSIQLTLPAQRFACLILSDATDLDARALSPFYRSLIRAGGVYFCAWGPDAEQLHLAADLACIEIDPDPAAEAPVILTTGHAEPIAEAVWFLLNAAYPDSPLDEGCDISLILLVACTQPTEQLLQAALSQIQSPVA